MVLTLLIIIGAASDIATFDRTRGGYEPPYTGHTGQPIDWDEIDVTKTGMARRGHILNTLFDCTSGMLSFEIFGQESPFRKVSERRIVVHKPREVCIERGFQPDFNSRPTVFPPFVGFRSAGSGRPARGQHFSLFYYRRCDDGRG